MSLSNSPIHRQISVISSSQLAQRTKLQYPDGHRGLGHPRGRPGPYRNDWRHSSHVYVVTGETTEQLGQASCGLAKAAISQRLNDGGLAFAETMI